jgi:serine protease Do
LGGEIGRMRPGFERLKPIANRRSAKVRIASAKMSCHWKNTGNRGKGGKLNWMLGIWFAVFAAHAAAADIRRDATVAAIERVLPSVVNISTETIVETRDPFDDLLREFWGPYYRRRAPNAQYSLGSGIIIDESGYVLTNDHVVRRASRIWVKLSEEAGGGEYEADRLIGTSSSDIALLKLRTKGKEKFKAIQFAGDDDLLLGETVLALGNPFGLGGSVSRGILSSKNRRPPEENQLLDVEDWLQTDAAINPGNSGGPLVNLRGELIGLNVAVYREGQGIGFAVPIKRVTEVLAEFFSPEAVKALWLGARFKAGAGPLVVTSVQPGSPADKGGLKTGDLVQQANGRAPANFIELSRILTAESSGTEVQLTVQRGQEQKRLAIRLVPEKDFFNAALIQEKLGLSTQELTRELAEQLGLHRYGGFIIAGVEKNSPAAAANLQPYYIIQAVDGGMPPDLTAFAKWLYGRAAGEQVKLNVLIPVRRGNLRGYTETKVEVKVR